MAAPSFRNSSNASNAAHRGSTREHDASFSRAPPTHSQPHTRGQETARAPSYSSASRDSSNHIEHSRAPVYIDRDDPKYRRSNHKEASHPEHFKRRRSRSPEASRLTDTHYRHSHQRSPVPWRHLRLATSTATAASPSTTTSSSKPVPLKSATTAATKRMATDISKWNRKQAELHADDSIEQSSNRSSNSDKPATRTSAALEGSKAGTTSAPSDRSAQTDSSGICSPSDVAQMSDAELARYDYRDQARLACLLCQRKFKALETLHRHESESQLHKDNLGNLETCRQAVIRKLKASSDGHDGTEEAKPTQEASPSIILTSEATPTYRDRASERRAVFGADTPSKSSTPSNNVKVFQGPKTIPAQSAREDPPPQSAPEKPIDSDNIGSRLLAMMGWAQGQGLGLRRQGRTDIVETKIYKPGVGLGSSVATDTASHEASLTPAPSRKVGSNVAFTGYLDRVKDRARQRLAEHSQHSSHQ